MRVIYGSSRPWKQLEGATKMFIDTHAHIQMPEFDGDRDETLARAKAAGI